MRGPHLQQQAGRRLLRKSPVAWCAASPRRRTPCLDSIDGTAARCLRTCSLRTRPARVRVTKRWLNRSRPCPLVRPRPTGLPTLAPVMRASRAATADLPKFLLPIPDRQAGSFVGRRLAISATASEICIMARPREWGAVVMLLALSGQRRVREPMFVDRSASAAARRCARRPGEVRR